MRSKTLTIILMIGQVLLVGAFLIRSDKRLSDFPAFYATARLWQKGEQPYRLDNQCREQRPFHRSECLPFVHPPILLPIQSLLVNHNYVASYWRWVVVLLIVLLLCLFPLRDLTGNTALSVQALMWQPVVASVWMGQDTAFIFAAIVFWVWLLCKQRDFLAGLALSLTVIKPHFAIALALPLLFSRRRAFAGFFVGGTVLTIYSLTLIGIKGFRGIIEIATLMATDQGYGLWREGMSNFAGLLARAGMDSPPLVWAMFVSGVAGVSYVWRRYGVTFRTISVALIIVMFTGPHIHPWDIAPLALPIAGFGMMSLLVSSVLLFALWPYRLLHVGCYIIMIWMVSIILRSRDHNAIIPDRLRC